VGLSVRLYSCCNSRSYNVMKVLSMIVVSAGWYDYYSGDYCKSYYNVIGVVLNLRNKTLSKLSIKQSNDKCA